MKENFDATQFITFDISDDNGHIVKQVRERFESLGFEVLQDNDIRKVKKQYFNEYIKTVFLELKDETFIGEIELWQDNTDMVLDERVKLFVEQLIWLYNQVEVNNLSLILTAFAEEGFTSNGVLEVAPDKILKGILKMSKYNFDIWVDNLVLEIV